MPLGLTLTRPSAPAFYQLLFQLTFFNSAFEYDLYSISLLSTCCQADFYGLKKYSWIKFSAGNAHVFHERLVIPYHSKGT
jgi:hypothetical protein